MAIPSNGVYRLAPYKNINQLIDIQGQSPSDYANAMIYSPNSGDPAGNHQKTFFYPTTADPSKYSFMFLHSGKRLDKEGASLSTKSNAIQYHAVDYLAQWWTPIEDTTNTGTLNGETLNSFEIALSNSLSTAQVYALDYANGQTANSTNVQVYYRNNTVAQRWFFVPDCYYVASLPVPSDIGIATAQYGDRLRVVPVGASTTLYPSWVCNWDKYQFRYRVRGRIASASGETWGSWSLWKSPANATTHDGWGNVWDDNCVPSAIKNERWASAITPTLDWTTYDAFELQMQVRAWTDSAFSPYEGVTIGGGGSSCTASVLLCYAPSVSCSTVKLSENGLEFAVSSDFQRNNNEWTISAAMDGDTLLFNDISFTGENYTDTLTVPWDKLLSIPSSGDSISFDISLATVDTTITESFTKTVSYATGSGATVTASIIHSGNDATCTVTSAHTSARYFMTYRHGAKRQTIEVEATYHPPFAAYELTVLAETSSGWGFATLSDSMESGSLVWDFDGKSIEIDEYDSGEKSLASKYSRSVKDYLFSGKDFHSYYFEHGGANDLSVSGCITDSPEVFDALKMASYAVFRRPDGYLANVAITGGSIEFIGGGLWASSIEQMECS